MPYFSGRVSSVVFRNDEEAYYVLQMTLDSTGPESVSVVGTVPGVRMSPGTWFGFDAKWSDHKKYGKQLSITRAPIIRGDWDEDITKKVLVSQGVGYSIVESIHKHFGSGITEKLNHVESIMEVPGITQMVAESICNKWKTARSMFLSMDFLEDLGLPKDRLRKIWSRFGDESKNVLSVNPWALVRIDGISFSDAENVAIRLGLDTGPRNTQRIEGIVLSAIRGIRYGGHVYMTTSHLVNSVRSIDPLVTEKDIVQAIKSLVSEKQVLVDSSTKPGQKLLYDPWYHEVEDSTASMLSERCRTAALSPERMSDYARRIMSDSKTDISLVGACNAFLERVISAGGMTPSEKQKQGILNAVTEPVSVITGLPGTGKTASLRMLTMILNEAGATPLILAPTGIAAKRVTSMTGHPAFTIHRALQAKGQESDNNREETYAGVIDTGDQDFADGSDEEWGYSSDNPHPATVVVVDESSMVDQHILYRLLQCTRKDARLVFVGDAAQLPSVGPGNVLRDMIDSGIFPTVSLTEVFRQSETSPIIKAAHDVFHGLVPETPTKTEFTLLHVPDDEKVAEVIVRLSQRLYEQRVNFQVLSFRHNGPVGVTTLNMAMREVINPRQPSLQEMKIGGGILREGDRIMISKNDYKLGIYNGDTGKIISIDKKNKEVEVKIHGPPAVHVRIPFGKAGKMLRMAYAVTVHKCLHPDTLVETSEGLLPIKMIKASGTVATPTGVKTYSNFVKNASDRAITMVTKDGYKLTATTNHGVDVWNGEQYTRKDIGEVVVGDVVRLALGVGCDVRDAAVLPGAVSHNAHESVYNIPSVVTNDVAEFFGLMVADGTLYEWGFTVGKRHAGIVDRFEHLCGVLFGESIKVKRFLDNNTYYAEVNSTFLARWICSVGGMSHNQKGVPYSILRSPSGIQKKFLMGLFGDGGIRNKSGPTDRVEFTTKVKPLAETVMVMLLRFGIPSSYLLDKNNQHHVCIHGQYALKFGDDIGFVTNPKQSRLNRGVAGRMTGYKVPVSAEEARHLRSTCGSVITRSLLHNMITRGYISIDMINRISGFNSPVLDSIRNRLGFHHTTVSSVTDTVCESMCIEVPDGHQFLQNGFAGWNSQGSEFDWIVMPIVHSFSHQLQRQIFYTAITRAKKNVVLVGVRSAMELAVLNNGDIRCTALNPRLIKYSASYTVNNG